MGETEFANGVAAMSASGAYGTPRICAGIISTVDLELGPERAGAALRAHMAASPNFRGIRAPIPAEFTTAYKEAFALLGEYDLLFESYHHDFETNLPRLVQLATEFPAVTFVINHLFAPCASSATLCCPAAPAEARVVGLMCAEEGR